MTFSDALHRPIDAMLCIVLYMLLKNCLYICLSHSWYCVETATCVNSSLSACSQLPRVLNNNNNKHDNVYGAVIMAEPLREFTRFI